MRCLVLLLAACARQVSTPVMTVAPSTEMSPVRAADEPTAKVDPTAIEIGCSYAIDRFHLIRATPLCPTRDTDCFANVEGSVYSKTAVMVPLGAVTHFVTVLELGAGRFRGQIRSADVFLSPSGATPIDGWIVPTGFESIRIDRASTGRLEIALVRTDDLEPMKPIGATWACDRVAFSNMIEPIDAERALVPDSQRTHSLRFLTGNVVLARDPGGEGVAHYGSSGSEVELLETRGANARILGHSIRAVFVAWIPANMLAPYSAPPRYASGHGRLGGSHTASGVICKRDIPLYARIGTKLVRVGEVMSGHRFDVEDVDGKKVVGIRSTLLTLLPNVTLEITFEDLETCQS